jgi:cytochrome c oxidase subunit 1/cytochrome c oxidase subunit I+III
MGEGRRSIVERGLVLDNDRETIATTAFDGQPDMVLKMPGDSIAPLLLAISLTIGFVGLLINLWWLAGLGAALCLASLAFWLWPRSALDQTAGAYNA